EKNVKTLANKDELVMRLYLLKSGRSQFVSHHVKKILLNTISIEEKLILEQQKLKTLGTKPIQCRRKFATTEINKSIIPIFPSMKRVEDLIEVFGELKVFLRVQVAENAISIAKIPRQVSAESANNVDERERYFEIGATLKIKWVQNQL
uniref:Uncharacterized protein n=1 Tax=Clytia hemisphaerica TaxID=252671 RepID=A0A7M5UUJ3_9CNID